MIIINKNAYESYMQFIQASFKESTNYYLELSNKCIAKGSSVKKVRHFHTDSMVARGVLYLVDDKEIHVIYSDDNWDITEDLRKECYNIQLLQTLLSAQAVDSASNEETITEDDINDVIASTVFITKGKLVYDMNLIKEALNEVKSTTEKFTA